MKSAPPVTLQPARSLEACPSLPEVHSKSFSKYEHELDIDQLKESLTSDNYAKKFHHLLCWEEIEHANLLKQRYVWHYLSSVCNQ